MLSYRHSFHAGNFADVIKHIVEVIILESLAIKPKPFVYFDTHAGAGRYDLLDVKSQKTGEYLQGIAKIINQTDTPQILLSYLNIINSLNSDSQLRYYPGSPLIAKLLMNRKKRIELTELHSTDYHLLCHEFINQKNINIAQKDGYQSLLSKLPPIQRRGLIFIDPPYELKDEYKNLLKALSKAYKKFSTGIYAIWYPVISRKQVEKFMQNISQLRIKNILRIELNIKQDQEGCGMTGTGMIIINPPWKLASNMKQVMPWLIDHLKENDHANYIVQQLVSE